MKELEIEAKVSNLHKVLEFVDEQLEAIECPIKTQMQIDVSVEEIFVNIANYAYGTGEGMAVIVTEFHDDPRFIDITFKDSGVEYNPLAKPDPDITLSAAERQIGGLGIYMVKKNMDDVLYEYTDGFNILTLRKSI